MRDFTASSSINYDIAWLMICLSIGNGSADVSDIIRWRIVCASYIRFVHGMQTIHSDGVKMQSSQLEAINDAKILFNLNASECKEDATLFVITRMDVANVFDTWSNANHQLHNRETIFQSLIRNVQSHSQRPLTSWTCSTKVSPNYLLCQCRIKSTEDWIPNNKYFAKCVWARARSCLCEYRVNSYG